MPADAAKALDDLETIECKSRVAKGLHAEQTGRPCVRVPGPKVTYAPDPEP